MNVYRSTIIENPWNLPLTNVRIATDCRGITTTARPFGFPSDSRGLL